MAEINIERKQGTAWPWIIAGIALLALLLWFLFARGDGNQVTNEVSPGIIADSVTDTSRMLMSDSGMMTGTDTNRPR